MSINENGFLDSDIQSWIAKHRKENGPLFEICYEVNQLAQTHLFKLNVHSNMVQEILVALLFVRALSAYQASLLLCERGMITETKIILRTLLEILFRLAAISKDEVIAKAYILEDEVYRKKFLNKFKSLSNSVKSAAGNPELDDLLNTLKKNIEEKDIKELQTQWFAHKARLDDFYNSAYSLFSSSVHANVRDLEELVVTNSEGSITQINFGPDVSGLSKLLFTAGEAMILILYDVSRLFSLEIEKQLTALHKRISVAIEGNENIKP